MALSIDDYTDEELGRIMRQAARGQQVEVEEVLYSRNSLAQFFRLAGFDDLADLVEAATWVWSKIKVMFRALFG